MMIFSFCFIALLIIKIAMIHSCDHSVTCGCSNYPPVYPKIVGGQNARTGTWNWVVAIRIRNRFYCAGSIISKSWILTAAHCFSYLDDHQTHVTRINPSEITVHAGSIHLREETQTRRVEKIIFHPQFEESTFNNDIALLQLSSEFHMNDENLAKICIPSISRNEYPPVGSSLVAVGWGKLWEDGPQSSVLQQTIIETIDEQDSRCLSLINDRSKQFCAGVENSKKDTCQGDSGGPLMVFTSSQQWVVAGVTSFGRGCAQPGSSGVYTRTAAYIDWINLFVNNLNSSIYPDSLIPKSPYDDKDLQWNTNHSFRLSISMEFSLLLSIFIGDYLLNWIDVHI